MEIVDEIIASYVPGNVLSLKGMYLYEMPDLPDEVTHLDLDDNYIKRIDKLPSNLKVFSVMNNGLTHITLPEGIMTVNLTHNSLTSLEIPASVQNLSIAYNQFESMPSLPSNLWYLDVSHNKIKDIEYLPDAMKGFICMHNQIEKLPNIPIYLEYIDCSNNKITELPYLTESLTQLICANNQITNIDSLPKQLSVFDCEGNKLSKLPTFGKEIKFISCANNVFTNDVKLPIKFRVYKFKPFPDIEPDVREPDHLDILPDCYDVDIHKEVRTSGFLSNSNNIVIKVYGCLYGISRQAILDYASDRERIFRDMDNDSVYVKVIMGKLISLIDFQNFANPKYSVYTVSRTMELSDFKNTVKPGKHILEKFNMYPFTLKRYIETDF